MDLGYAACLVVGKYSSTVAISFGIADAVIGAWIGAYLIKPVAIGVDLVDRSATEMIGHPSL